MTEMKENIITQLTDREHVLLRPGTYIGATTLTECSTFIIDPKTEKCTWKTVKYVPGLLKICYEILDNSVDEFLRTNGQFSNKIDVIISDDKQQITISDNGRGIPLKMTTDADGKEISQFELALTNLRAGSNFNDKEGRNLLGQNGIGSSCTTIFSTNFHAISRDGENIGDLCCADNMSTVKCKIKPIGNKLLLGKSGTSIEFTPDYKRFGLTKLTDIHVDLIYQRLMFLSYMYPEIRFTFNKQTVKFKNAKSLINIFSNQNVVVSDNKVPCKYMIGIIPNENDDFTHKSYINGADCINGGNHLDYIHGELLGRIREKLCKKYPSIRLGDIKNKLSYIICFREFINPMFNSQTKENFSSDTNEIKEFLKDIDWDDLTNRVCKNDAIIEPIIETFKIKEEFKNRQALAKMGATRKKIKCEKYYPAIKVNKYFSILEGDSALAGLMDGLGRQNIGYFSTRGVPLNSYEVSAKTLSENLELSNIIKILGLKPGNDTQDMNYEYVLLSSDADADAAHIKALYVGFFQKYAPSIIKAKKLCMLRTPIICLKDKGNNIVEMFFTFDEYNTYMEKHKDNKHFVHYYKGLGSWKANELQNLVKKFGFDYFIEPLEYDDETPKMVDDWLSKKNADIRREYLRNNTTFSIAKV